MRLFRKLALLLGRRRFHDELREEMTFHREQTQRDLEMDGLSRLEASHAAQRQFGNEMKLREQSHEMVSFRIENLWRDVRYAVRQMLRSPGFAITVVVTLALGIGATTAMYSLVYEALLRNLPYRNAGRILHIEDQRAHGRSNGGLVGLPRYFDMAARSHAFERMAYFYFDHPTMIPAGQMPLAAKAATTSGSFWNLFGVQPLLGRTFGDSDCLPNAPDAVVLSYGAWQQWFGGDASVIGKPVLLDQKAATIVGVMPQSFQIPSGIDLWRPSHFAPGQFRGYRGDGTRFVNVYARIRNGATQKDGVTQQQAEAELGTIGHQLQQEYAPTDGEWRFSSETLRDSIYGSAKPALLVLLLAAATLLLIACINVANLLLSRATVRAREVALRRAMGASDGRIVLQLLAESVLLALTGGVLGVAGALVVVRVVTAKLPGIFALQNGSYLQWPVMCFALALSIVAGIGFGLAPVWQSRRRDLAGALQSGEARIAGSAGTGARSVFIAVQVGLSLMLLVGACLLAESLWKLMKTPFGFDPEHVLTFSANLPWNAKPAEIHQFFSTTQQDISTLPGVNAVGQIDALPTTDWHLRSNFDADWLPRIPDKPAINAEDRHIGGDYLNAVETKIVAGRGFEARDYNIQQTPVLVNQALAQQYLPAGDPVGKHLIIGTQSFEIIGVVGNIRGTSGSIRQAPGPEVYFPMDDDQGVVERSFVVRSNLPADQLAREIRDIAHRADPRQAIANVKMMDELLDKVVAQPRLNMALLASFAAIALLLACVGIYGVVSYSVAQRKREIGVRMALGATRPQISLLFLRRTMISAGLGLCGGIIATLLLARLLQSQLYGVEPNDPIILTVAILLLLLPVLPASLRPALRAASVDPVEALRTE
ncbi:ADOP family duplicated permease [Acidicapsa dinghuensis]|uniref:ADOP family duplicated permease n=1 Tax=Acidicapsa dinghuensis TaxID=2218256 RepID=A0ABW1EEH6_9BACT|nr:ABC transporter permease [Acidicapsa dinghuensis]